MSALLGALLLATAGVVTWLHLSARAQRKGRPFPSVQHLGGTPLPKRPTWPVEQPVRLLLRLGALLLLGLALWGFARGQGSGESRVALVDPGSGGEGWRRARVLAGVTIVAGFEGERPRVEGDDARAARVRASLEDCSARPIDCLLRAARAGEARPVVVSDFVDGAWSAALAGESFDFLRLGTAGMAGASGSATSAATSAGTPDGAATPSPAPTTRGARSAGPPAVSPWVLLWRSALDAAAAAPRPAAGGAFPDIRVFSEPGPARAPCPSVERTDPRPLRWDGLSALATARTAVPAGATLRFREESGATPLLDGLAVRTSDGTLCLASDDRELGRWAHDGTLAVLGRALRPWVAPPLTLREAPPGGTERWLDAAGASAAVGLADIPPGQYRRDDGQVLLSLARPEVLAPAPLTDADLVARGGAPWRGGTSTRWPWPLWALIGVALLRLLDLPERQRPSPPATDISTRSLIPRKAEGSGWVAVGWAAGLAVLAAALLGIGWSSASVPERWMRILGTSARGADASLATGGLRTVRGTSPLACAAPASESPCVEAARASAQLEPGIDTWVSDDAAPGVSLLDVQLPSEVPLGMAAQVRVDVRLQHARGMTLTVDARAPGAAPVSEQRLLGSDDEVLRLELALLPAAEGVLPVLVSARTGPVADARLRALVVRRRPVRRLVLAGAPSWEARRAAEVLDLPPARVDVLTRIGRTATASRPQGLPLPAALLTSPETLDGYTSIALIDPGDWLGPDAVAGLTAWVERGGGLIVLGRGRLPATLIPGPSPSGPAGLPHRLQARWRGNSWSFEGFDATEGPLSPGTAVLGEVGPSNRPARPWVVGQAVGQGRVLQFLAEDAWRLSPPGGDATRLSALLGAAVAWVEAARSVAPVTVTEDARSVLWTDDAGRHRTPFGFGQQVAGLELANLPAALDLPIRLRGEAARAGKPWIHTTSWPELGRAWARAPAPATLRRHARVRTHPATWAVWAALLTVEVALRRGRRRRGPSATDETELHDEAPRRRSA